jgi:hypothetical protein
LPNDIVHRLTDLVADCVADLATGAGDRTPVEIVVAQDEVGRPLGQGREGRSQNLTLGDVLRDDQRIRLVLDGQAELPPRRFAGTVQMDVGRPGQSHGFP